MEVFRGRRLPETATPAGYSALIDAFDRQVPLPRRMRAIGRRHRIRDYDRWRIMTPRHAPAPTLEGHLTFALKYEGLDLAVLKRLFLTISTAPIEEIARARPTGSYARRVWFLFEWLTGRNLDLPDAKSGRYVPVLNPSQQVGIDGETAPRYRLRNNLPGTPEFCPLVFRTKTLEEFAGLELPRRARDAVADVPRDVLARTAAFLLLKDSRASFVIEGERPPLDRIQRWGSAIGEAGRRPRSCARSTDTATRWNPIRTACCHTSDGSRPKGSTSGSRTTLRTSTASSTPLPTRSSSTTVSAR